MKRSVRRTRTQRSARLAVPPERRIAMKESSAAYPSLARLFPFLRWWPMVDRHTTRADLIAGLTGAILGLPQGVAFAILAGLPPEYGLYAAMERVDLLRCSRAR